MSQTIPTALVVASPNSLIAAVSSQFPFNQSSALYWATSHGSNHSWKDEQGVVKERQEYAYQ